MDDAAAARLTEYPEDRWLMISGIQHYVFCKRQWALIHIEHAWQENYLTKAGELEHERAHDYRASESRGDMLIMRDLRVFSRTLGVTGACDVVEFRKSDSGVVLHGRGGRWHAFPVEYKHGSSKLNDADRMQLCVEAMCLEEMLGCTIPEGALFYQRVKHRETVRFDDTLRRKVSAIIKEMHSLYMRGTTPKARKRKECASCSLRDLCLPELSRLCSVQEYLENVISESKPA